MFLPEEQFTEQFPQLKRLDRNLFWDRGSKILAVAHLDSVSKCTHAIEVKFPHKWIFYSPVLDDRLGAYMLLEELFDLPYDILLTTDEEKGNSSARDFVTDKQYNWIFEFDRKGTDVVLYSYEDAKTRKLLTDSNFIVGNGSVSDISYMTKLGCKAFNFGVCYYDYHSLDGYANLDELTRQTKKFREFFALHSETFLEHVPKVDPWSNHVRYYGINDDDYSPYGWRNAPRYNPYTFEENPIEKLNTKKKEKKKGIKAKELDESIFVITISIKSPKVVAVVADTKPTQYSKVANFKAYGPGPVEDSLYEWFFAQGAKKNTCFCDCCSSIFVPLKDEKYCKLCYDDYRDVDSQDDDSEQAIREWQEHLKANQKLLTTNKE